MFLTVDQAANFLKKDRFHINYLIHMNKLEAVKFGKEWRIAPKAVENYEKQISTSTDCYKKIIESQGAILSIRDIAVCFQYEWHAIHRLITGQIPAWKDDEGNWCIARSDLLEYCSKRLNLCE